MMELSAAVTALQIIMILSSCKTALPVTDGQQLTQDRSSANETALNPPEMPRLKRDNDYPDFDKDIDQSGK